MSVNVYMHASGMLAATSSETPGSESLSLRDYFALLSQQDCLEACGAQCNNGARLRCSGAATHLVWARAAFRNCTIPERIPQHCFFGGPHTEQFWSTSCQNSMLISTQDDELSLCFTPHGLQTVRHLAVVS